MHLFLDIQRRRMHHQVGPVLLILAAPDQLRIEIAVATFVSHTDGALVILLQHRLVFSRRDVLARRLLVREGCYLFLLFGFSGHFYFS